MNYKGHLIGGIVTSSLVAGGSFVLSGNLVVAGVSALITLMAALYPDLDVASKPSRHAFLLGIPTILLMIYLGYYIVAILLFLLISIPKMFPHRGLVHTLKFGVLVSVCSWYIINPFLDISYYYVLGSSLLGYMTHLILDKHIRI